MNVKNCFRYHGKNYETHKYNYILNYHGGLYGRQSVGLDSPTHRTSLAIIALGVVLQVIFGAAVPFLGLDIVGSVVALVKQFGSEGLVGLVAVWVLWGIYSKK